MQRGDGDAELIDGGRVVAGGADGHAVVAGLDDAGDVRHGAAGGDTRLVLGGLVAELGEDEVGDGGAGGFEIDAGVADVIAVGIDHRLEEVGGGGVGSQVGVVPGSRSAGDVARLGIAVVNAVVNYLLGELLAALPEGVPKGSLLLLGPVGEVGVVGAGGHDEVQQQVHAGAVLLHALDGHGVEGGAAVIGRVAQNVHAEDDVVDGHRGAVGEDDVVAQRDVVIDGAVVILDDLDVGDAGVGVIGAVVAAGLALDAVEDGVALAVNVEEGLGGHDVDVLVIGGLGEEGAELRGEVVVADDQLVVAVGFEQLDVVHPIPEGGDVGGDGVYVDTLGAHDEGVLALVDGDLNSPVEDDVEALLVGRLAEGLVGAGARLHDELVKRGIAEHVGVGVGAARADSVGAVVDLVHVRVGSGLPGSAPDLSGNGVGLNGLPDDVGVGGVVYLQVDADGGEGLFGVGQDAVGRVIANTVCGDYRLIAEGVFPGAGVLARGRALVGGLTRSRGGFAAGGQSEDHGEREGKRQEFLQVFAHFHFSSLFWVSFY